MDSSRELTEVVALRRELHAHAELAGQETETGRIIRAFLESCEPDGLVTELAGVGLAAVYEGPEKGPAVMFRAEMDAIFPPSTMTLVPDSR